MRLFESSGRAFSKKLHEHFDLIAGTSTGGIIALGLGTGKSANELLDFYKNHGPTIFPQGNKWKLGSSNRGNTDSIAHEIQVVRKLV